MADKISAPRGTKDVIPAESYKWQYLEYAARHTARAFGFSEIRFPTFEHTELFQRGVGDTTDVVQKEMYTFQDKGGRSVTLRPEGTASVVRSLIENSLHAAGLPVKVYYIAPNFRYEKPQAGRLREHHQFGVECFGAPGAQADAEIIALADTFLSNLGISGVSLNINSIGCPDCRKDYHKALHEYFSEKKDQLCDTCLDRLERNPMRILDCKNESCSVVSQDAPVVLDYLCEDCRTHFSALQEHLRQMNIIFQINPRIVRGLDYYTRTVFEFISDQIGAQGTILAGGRYDGLVQTLGGPCLPGLGFGCGLERLLLIMQAQGIIIPQPPGCQLFIATAGEAAGAPAQVLVGALRRQGISVQCDIMDRGLKAQMKYANRIGARYSCVIGDDEIGAGSVDIRNMDSGETVGCALDAQSISELMREAGH